MVLDLYHHPMSIYSRSVRLTARAVGVELNLKEIDFLKKEQLKPEFVALNPQHSVPTFVDGDLVLWESRAICKYLVSQYGKDDSLYPKDPKIRAKIDALLDFDLGTLAARYTQFFYPVYRGEIDKPTQASLDRFYEAFRWMEGFLKNCKFVAGTDHLTVADHVLVANLSSFQAAGFISEDYPNIIAWISRCKDAMEGYEELNAKGAKIFGDFLKAQLADKKD